MLGHTYVHLLAPACTRLHLLAPAHTFRTRAGVRTCEFSHIRTFTHISKNFFAKQNSGSHTMHVAHILHACGCADVRNFAHPHFHTHIQNFFCKKKLWQPHHAHCTHFARVRVCGRAKFCTSALSHTYPKNFWKKKLWQPHHAHCTHFASVRVCGRAKFRTSALSHTFPNFFLQKKKTPAATPCTLHTFCKRAGVRTCEISHICTFTHISKIFFAKKKLWQPHHAHCTHFARVRVCGRAKFRTSALSHTFPKKILQKKGLGTCKILHIRYFLNPFHTHAKCF